METGFAPRHRRSSMDACHLRIGAVGGLILVALSAISNPPPIIAQTAPWNSAVSAAKKEGKVVVFGPAGEVIRNAIVDGFKKSFPAIVLEYVGGRAAEGAARLPGRGQPCSANENAVRCTRSSRR